MITAAQLKGRIKNMCDGDSKKAETLLRLYFMERFLERVYTKIKKVTQKTTFYRLRSQTPAC